MKARLSVLSQELGGPRSSLDLLVHGLLRALAAHYRWRPSLRRLLHSADGWIDFSVGFTTRDDTVGQSLTCRQGRFRVQGSIPSDADVVLDFVDEAALWEMLWSTPNEVLTLLLRNRVVVDGNLACLQLFNFLVSRLVGPLHRRRLAKRVRAERARRREVQGPHRPDYPQSLARRARERLRGSPDDPGVCFLDEPYLSRYSLADFPRLERLRRAHFAASPRLCVERPLLLTRWFRSHGFEHDRQGQKWSPTLRQAEAFHHLLSQKRPIIGKDDLLAGTTTSHEVGVLIYPDAQGTLIWGELGSVADRELNPYQVSEGDAELLHREVFPFWMRRNFAEFVRSRDQDVLAQQIAGRFVAYFVWKTVGISHTIPDFQQVLSQGLSGIRSDIAVRLSSDGALARGERDTLRAMDRCLESILLYARNLASEARKQAAGEADPARRVELWEIAERCARVPEHPARSLAEAVQSLWIVWIALHQENTNTGLSLGRLDQLLQPFFEADLRRLQSPVEREAAVRRAVELVGCLFLRCADHLPLVPDIGNYLFSGSASDQAVTVGGVTRDGEDAVCDMTYVILKVTELLGLRDPNVNARVHPEHNSDTYLRRLLEVNRTTGATPSLHNDHAVMEALEPHGFDPSDLRDWSATGCVEPTLSGHHMGHTGAILFNLVAPLEMALRNGRHPLMRWDLGPSTGRPEQGAFTTFEEFFEAYASQLAFLVEQATALNVRLAEAHAVLRPTPLLSALIGGCIQHARDATLGGARYNTSGTANIGLADVTDSLLAIRKLVYEERSVTWAELCRALERDFRGDADLLALIGRGPARFGSGDEEALAMAERLSRHVSALWASKTGPRGGPYTTGFWSMSQHVAYGSLTGALPSGRRAGKAFTPGLTPHPGASDTFLDNIHDVARLPRVCADNNLAFNVKLAPGMRDSVQETVATMAAYARAYFELGGMQIQFNVMSSELLRDAMAHPEHYPDLLVRISGYNAYFVTLDRQMQEELIERAEFRL